MSGGTTKRRLRDVFKLLGSGFECSTDDESAPKELLVKFRGPKNSPYEGGVWKVCVKLPNDYPFKSPSIGFCNRIYHPNIDEMSGSVCLDVINQTWSSMFTLVAVFDQFLPQLLMYPNPSDPLNGQAAALLMKSKEAYEERVKEYVTLYAQNSSTKLGMNGDDDGAADMDAEQEDADDEDLEDAEDEELSDADDDIAF